MSKVFPLRPLDIRDTRLLLFDGKSALRRKDVQDIKIV